MSAVETPVNPDLNSWASIDRAMTSSGLLIGNGASRVVWDHFTYGSLFDKAKSLTSGKALTPADESIFVSLGTENFETVLYALAITNKVLTAVGKPDPGIMVCYKRVRNALVEAVHDVHVDYAAIPKTTLQTIGKELSQYEFVYSTNYDLLLYWSMFEYEIKKFADYFFTPDHSFDPARTQAWKGRTKVLFVHGGLHLYQNTLGISSKLTAGDQTLLSNFLTGSTIPLFVSEGDPSDKLSTIYKSPYLSFAYNCLSQHNGPLVIFGQGLSDPDKHLVDAINRAKVNTLVVGIYPSSAQEIIDAKVHYRKCFPNKQMHFFDSKTHPMGSPSLKVSP